MMPPQDVGKLIMKVLHEKKDAVEADYMAYLTGSTITQVLEEGFKLQESCSTGRKIQRMG